MCLIKDFPISRKTFLHVITEHDPLPVTDGSYDVVISCGSLMVNYIPPKSMRVGLYRIWLLGDGEPLLHCSEARIKIFGFECSGGSVTGNSGKSSWGRCKFYFLLGGGGREATIFTCFTFSWTPVRRSRKGRRPPHERSMGYIHCFYLLWLLLSLKLATETSSLSAMTSRSLRPKGEGQLEESQFWDYDLLAPPPNNCRCSNGLTIVWCLASKSVDAASATQVPWAQVRSSPKFSGEIRPNVP